MNRVPIVWINRIGLPAAASHEATPMLRVGLHYDTQHGTGPRNISGYETALALVDTGADNNFADPAILRRTGLPAHTATTVQGATASMNSQMHLGHLFFETLGKQIETDIISTPLRANGRPYELVLGVLFLKMGTLHMDFGRNDFWFEFA